MQPAATSLGKQSQEAAATLEGGRAVMTVMTLQENK